MKQNKLPKPTVFAHGAVKPVEFIIPKGDKYWTPELELRFGSTVCGDHDYPVRFFKLSDVKALHAYLGKCIKYVEGK